MKHLGPACHGQAEVGASRKEDFILSAFGCLDILTGKEGGFVYGKYYHQKRLCYDDGQKKSLHT